MNRVYFGFLIIFYTHFTYSLTPEKAMELALERSLTLKAQDMEIQALKGEAILQGRLSNPQVMGQIGTINASPEKGSTLEVSITQAIPLTNKLGLKSKIAKMMIESKSKQTEYFSKWIKHQTLLSMWRVYISDEIYQHGVERARRFSLIKKNLQARASVSTKQKVEKNIIEALLAQLEKEQDAKKHNLFLALNDLEYWTGQRVNPSDIKLKIPKKHPQYEVSDFNIQNSPELLMAQNKVVSAELNSKLINRERIPDLYLGYGYREENVSPNNKFNYGIIGFNIPLWDRGGKKSEIAKIHLNIEKNNYENLERQLSLLQQNQVELVKMSLHQIQRFPESLVKNNEKSIQDAERGFKQGVIDVNLFIQAETQSHEVIDQVYLTWIHYLENLSTLLLSNNQDLNWETK